MLFNKDNNGSLELQELTGVFYANNNFSTIAAEIETAERSVKSFVGASIIEEAHAQYESAEPDMQLVNLVRMPIAWLAVHNWSKLNLVSHEDTGRKMKVDESEKVPFEWMIDRDDRELRERYYRALDALLAYIAEDPGKWGVSALESESIIKSLTDLEKIFPIEGSYYSFQMLLPLFVDVQRTKLMKFVPADKMEEIKTEPDGNLAYHARRYVVLEALAIAVRRWSLTVFPLMVARRFAPSYQGNNEHSKATLKEISWYLETLAVDSALAKEELQDLLSDGTNHWQEVKLIPENDRRNKFFNAG